MKVKVFRFTVCECQSIGRPPRMERTGLTPSEIEERVNSFCETVNVVSISVSPVTYKQHDGGGYDDIELWYNIVYQAK